MIPGNSELKTISCAMQASCCCCRRGLLGKRGVGFLAWFARLRPRPWLACKRKLAGRTVYAPHSLLPLCMFTGGFEYLLPPSVLLVPPLTGGV